MVFWPGLVIGLVDLQDRDELPPAFDCEILL
jgi:hypothetical protein